MRLSQGCLENLRRVTQLLTWRSDLDQRADLALITTRAESTERSEDSFARV